MQGCGAGGRLDGLGLLLSGGVRGDGLEGVDGEGVEEFVGNYEGGFVFACKETDDRSVGEELARFSWRLVGACKP